jgi:hypothetical protein
MALVVALNTNFDAGIEHSAVPDRLVKKGSVVIQTRDLPQEQNGNDFYQTRIKYNFVIETLFSRRTRKGEETFKLPNSFKDEQGYLDLQLQNRYEDKNILMVHRGRKNWKGHYDCHIIKLVPKYKDTWDGEFFYCPDAPKSGIVELRFRVKNIPFLGEHTIVSRWDN